MSDMKQTDWMQVRKELNAAYRSTLKNVCRGKKVEPWSLNIRDVLDYIPVSSSTIKNWINIGYFPKPYRKVKAKNLWRMSEVFFFLDECIANENSYNDHIKQLDKGE